MNWVLVLEVLKNACLVTGLVMVMMMMFMIVMMMLMIVLMVMVVIQYDIKGTSFNST